MSPLVMFNHLLFVNTFPARSLSQSAPGPPGDPETENIPFSFPGLEGGSPFAINLKASQEPQSDPLTIMQRAVTSRWAWCAWRGWGTPRLTAFPLFILSVFPGLSVHCLPPPVPTLRVREDK